MSPGSDRDLRLRLELVGVPASVGLVRAVIRQVARGTGLDSVLVDDMRSAISEACNNVVLHAYPSVPGPLIFSLEIRGEAIEAVVRDQGNGIRPGAGANRGLGMGMALINSLADRAQFESSELGTEVRMHFRRPAGAPRAQAGVTPGLLALTDRRASAALRAPSS